MMHLTKSQNKRLLLGIAYVVFILAYMKYSLLMFEMLFTHKWIIILLWFISFCFVLIFSALKLVKFLDKMFKD